MSDAKKNLPIHSEIMCRKFACGILEELKLGGNGKRTLEPLKTSLPIVF